MKAVYSYNGDFQVNLMESSTDIRCGERQMIYMQQLLQIFS